ncbi:MAG TPA: DUF1987 domain-containing protein [Bacteroidia bacterium]|jgi:hypothetical protein|nr:DUF1987 domain-containing protein [Bacteroidia bacterium]
MKKLSIEARDHTPAVTLDKENAVMEIKGYSFPDEAFVFYSEIVAWFKEYVKEPNTETKMVFDFKYLNSTSAKFINDILKSLDSLVAAGKKVSVEWYFDADDEDIQQLGSTLKEFHKVSFSVLLKTPQKEPGKKKLF